MLYLQRGVWNGQRLLSEEWVAQATRVQLETETPYQPNPDWRQGYGFQFWMSRHGYRGDGAYGRFCVVLPEQDAVIATTAATENMQDILDSVWTHLVPAMMATPVKPSPVAEQLVARLAGLQLAAFQAKPAPDTSAAAWAEASYLPAGGRCEAQPTLTGVKLHQDGEHWRPTRAEGHVAFSATVGTGSWQTTLTETDDGGSGPPLAVGGGWTDEDTFGAEIIFLETPHRLELTCSRRTGTFQARWRTVPLHAGSRPRSAPIDRDHVGDARSPLTRRKVVRLRIVDHGDEVLDEDERSGVVLHCDQPPALRSGFPDRRVGTASALDFPTGGTRVSAGIRTGPARKAAPAAASCGPRASAPAGPGHWPRTRRRRP